VRDEGRGIAADELLHIFEEYFRATGAHSQEGLGLGLYICRLVVEAHGGRIWDESVLGKGSTFSVAIPTARAGEAHLLPTAPTTTALSLEIVAALAAAS
jgi:signal transduction histidine kinase